MKELPSVTQTPVSCGGDNFHLIMHEVESSTLDKAQIEKVVVLNPLSNEIEISTDDLATYVDQEATIELKIVSKTSQEPGSLYVKVKFEHSAEKSTAEDT